MDKNIRKFTDGLHFAREQNIDAAAILFDFKKACDNVSHTFFFAMIDIMCGVPLALVWEDLHGAQQPPPGEYVYRHSHRLTPSLARCRHCTATTCAR